MFLFINIGDYAKMVKISNDGHFYEAFFEGTFNTTNTVSNMTNNERTYQTNMTVGVIGYLIGEGNNQIRAKVIKRENAVDLKNTQRKSNCRRCTTTTRVQWLLQRLVSILKKTKLIIFDINTL